MPSRRRVLAVLVSLALALGALVACRAESPPARAVVSLADLQPKDAVRGVALRALAAMTPEQKIAALIVVHVAGTQPAPLRRRIARDGVAGLILMGDNTLGGSARVRRLTRTLGGDPALPPLTLVDQEGGIVARLPDPDPAGAELRHRSPAEVERIFARRAERVADAGLTVNLGIVADVTGDRRAFLWERSLGGTPAAAASRVAAAVAGEHGTVLSTLKHFPGHGGPVGDSHRLIPSTGQSVAAWRREAAPPFQAGIEAGAELVMFGHLRYTAVDSRPATLSPRWHRILREELGFDGVIITDDMNMLEYAGARPASRRAATAVEALAAGNDLLLYVGDVDVGAVSRAGARALERGDLDAGAIDASVLRVLLLRARLGAGSGAPS